MFPPKSGRMMQDTCFPPTIDDKEGRERCQTGRAMHLAPCGQGALCPALDLYTVTKFHKRREKLTEPAASICFDSALINHFTSVVVAKSPSSGDLQSSTVSDRPCLIKSLSGCGVDLGIVGIVSFSHGSNLCHNSMMCV